MNYEKININMGSSHTINLAANKRATVYILGEFSSLSSGYTYPETSISGKVVKSAGPGDVAEVYMMYGGNATHICSIHFNETSISVNATSNGNGILTVNVSETDSIDVSDAHHPITDINWNGHKITNLADPANTQDAATKSYADGNFIKRNGSNSPTTNISWGGHRITNLADPTDDQDAVTLAYFNDNASSTATPGDRGVFGGGFGPSTYSNVIDYIQFSIPGNAQDFGDLTVARDAPAATSNGVNDIGVFGGGENGDNLKTIDYIQIHTPWDAHDFGELTVKQGGPVATSNGTSDIGVFGSGSGGNVIDYIQISAPGNAQPFGSLTVARDAPAATSNGVNDIGVFGGGYDGQPLKTIDYIQISAPGNAQPFGNLTDNRSRHAATSNGVNDIAVFAGGQNVGSILSSIDWIQISAPGNAQPFGSLTGVREFLAATSNGTNDMGVFGAGYDGIHQDTTAIEYIQISIPGNARPFGDLTSGRNSPTATSNGLL